MACVVWQWYNQNSSFYVVKRTVELAWHFLIPSTFMLWASGYVASVVPRNCRVTRKITSGAPAVDCACVRRQNGSSRGKIVCRRKNIKTTKGLKSFLRRKIVSYTSHVHARHWIRPNPTAVRSFVSSALGGVVLRGCYMQPAHVRVFISLLVLVTVCYTVR